MSIKVEFCLEGHFCHHWPQIEIYHDGRLVQSLYLQGLHTIALDLDCGDRSSLRLRHVGKKFGENGIWDTDATNQKDCFVEIKDIRFNGISIGRQKISELVLTTEWTDQQRLTNDPEFLTLYQHFACASRIGFNGYIDIEFTQPIYNWLIMYKYKINAPGEVSYFSASGLNWHYEEDIKIIKEIKELMNLA